MANTLLVRIIEKHIYDMIRQAIEAGYSNQEIGRALGDYIQHLGRIPEKTDNE